jgi:CheY-like chemotaxis protein
MPGGIQYNEEKLVGEDHHLQDDWKQDKNLFFIQFSIIDTGRGLTEREMGSLFTRFSQASPRTHIHYGGSGLGLFISRRLTELQGGAIGLTSKPKKGSTFAFYIKTRGIKPTMVRESSIPSILPEDIRHRPQTPLVNMSRPPPPLRIPSYRTDDSRRSTSPSPQLLWQPSFMRQSALAQMKTPSEVPELNMTPDMHQLKITEELPETIHVLVVEDNLVNQKVLAKQLRNLGCVVHVANHGREALEFLERTVYWNHQYPNLYPTSHRPSCHIRGTEPLSSHSDDSEVPLELTVVLMDWEMVSSRRDM